MSEARWMHWKVKALSAILVINLLLLLSIGAWLLVNRPSDDEGSDGQPQPSVVPVPVAPAEIPPLPAPEAVATDQ